MRGKQKLNLTVLNQTIAHNIDEIIKENEQDETRLIGILLEVQKIIPKQYIPMEVAAYVSQKMHIPLSRVYDVISFYSALSDVPRGTYVIQICDSVACRVTGETFLKETIESTLHIKNGQGTDDGKFYLEYTPCFGACDMAPALRLNGKVYGNLNTKEKIESLFSSCK